MKSFLFCCIAITDNLFSSGKPHTHWTWLLVFIENSQILIISHFQNEMPFIKLFPKWLLLGKKLADQSVHQLKQSKKYLVLPFQQRVSLDGTLCMIVCLPFSNTTGAWTQQALYFVHGIPVLTKDGLDAIRFYFRYFSRSCFLGIEVVLFFLAKLKKQFNHIRGKILSRIQDRYERCNIFCVLYIFTEFSFWISGSVICLFITPILLQLAHIRFFN